MTAIVRAQGLGKRFGRRWALSECTVDIPAGRVVGLVGPNGAGKTTLLRLAVGQLAPTTGDIEVLGGRPAADAAQLSRVGYVAQAKPLYSGLTVEEHLMLGDRLNPRWDWTIARDHLESAGLDSRQRAGRLSGGQRAQLSLAIALAKRPDLLILDEPVSALDPLARREFFQGLMEAATSDVSVILSSHVIADLERICDYLVILAESRVRLAGDIEELLAAHHHLIGPRSDVATPPDAEVITKRHTERQTTLLVRGRRPVDPAWTVAEVGLEDLVLAYMKSDAAQPSPMEVVR